MQEDYLDVTSRTQFDDSVSKISYHSYLPHNILTINNSDEIRISINNQDLLTLPSRSYLYIKADIKNHDKGHLVNNGLAFLFDEIRYEIANKEVDMVRNPGIASLMKLVCTGNKNYKYSNAAIDSDDNLKAIHKDGKFSGCLPMDMLMGVFEDFNKVLVNVKQELILKRAKDDNNCLFTTEAVPATGADVTPSIQLTSVQWHMPHVTPSDAEKLSLQRLLLQNKMLQIPFRSYELHELPSFPQTTKHIWAVKTSNQLEKPRYVIYGWQTKRDGAPRKRSDMFDHCNTKKVTVYINDDRHPYTDYNLDFANNEVSQAYESVVRLRESYYNTPADPFVSRKDYATKYPLIAIDTSKQNESLKEGVVDIKLEIETTQNVPANTSAYVLIIHDKMFEYNPMTNEINKL